MKKYLPGALFATRENFESGCLTEEAHLELLT
jgi:hypothetical protein